MMKKIVIVLLVMMLSACSSVSGSERFSTVEYDYFDTVIQVLAMSESEANYQEEEKFIFERIEYYNQQFDIYNEYEGVNNMRTINQNAGIKPVEVDQTIIDVLLFSKEMYELTDGKVNVAMGPVLYLWHLQRIAAQTSDREGELPNQNELDAANLLTDINKIIIDDENNTVYLEEKGMRLDVGAVAKGYAAQKVTEELIAEGYDNYAISFGGNVITKGHKENNQPWRIGVSDPNGGADLVYLDLVDKTVVSSGDYQRYFMVDGVRYHHIIDPLTLYPANYYRAVSIVCEDSGLADALSTGVYLMELEAALALIESLDGVEALFIDENNELIYSSGFEDYLVQE
ncbi:MAG: FAD:protein FMN transferase [Erysipelotrichaceae bacterium]